MGGITASSDRITKLEEIVWSNLRSTGILKRILEKSAHGSSKPESEYNAVEFNSELGRGMMWIEIMIQPISGAGYVAPKIYRLATSTEEQTAICNQIWAGVLQEDIKHIALVHGRDYNERDKRYRLSPEQSDSIKRLHPSIEAGTINIDLVPIYARWRISGNS